MTGNESSQARSARSTRHSLPSAVVARSGGESVIDEDGGDRGGGGEGIGVKDPGAGSGAIDEQGELLAELLGVGRAGFAGGVGEPRGNGLLVVACALGRGVLGVVELHGGSDVRAQGCVWGGIEGGEEPFAGVRSVRSNTPDSTEGSNRRRYSATSSSLPPKC